MKVVALKEQALGVAHDLWVEVTSLKGCTPDTVNCARPHTGLAEYFLQSVGLIAPYYRSAELHKTSVTFLGHHLGSCQ